MNANGKTNGSEGTNGTGTTSLRARLEALRASRAYANYQRALNYVLYCQDQRNAAADPRYKPSDYWLEELQTFDYMFDASPLIINKLRQHCSHITGLRVYDYRSNRTDAQKKFAEKLAALKAAGGADLLVPESRELGGYGFDIEGELFNIDTLKFYEVLIALHRGEVLREFRGNAERKAVCEIGTGWGGFAYQFKKLCPNTTYFLLDIPELFIFSATYLMTVFPEARVGFYGEPGEDVLANWAEYDFVFVPNHALHEFRPVKLDLTLNMVSFQEMTSEQVEAYVEMAYRLQCPYLYSLNRDRSPYNPQISGVHDIIGKYYWPHDVYVLPVTYNKMMDAAGKQERVKSPFQYKHLVGWRKLKLNASESPSVLESGGRDA
jgi:hypothetical protein